MNVRPMIPVYGAKTFRSNLTQANNVLNKNEDEEELKPDGILNISAKLLAGDYTPEQKEFVILACKTYMNNLRTGKDSSKALGKTMADLKISPENQEKIKDAFTGAWTAGLIASGVAGYYTSGLLNVHPILCIDAGIILGCIILKEVPDIIKVADKLNNKIKMNKATENYLNSK